MGDPKGTLPSSGPSGSFPKPAPDAEDRLRRLFTLLLEHAARKRQAAPEMEPLSETDLPGDHIEAES